MVYELATVQRARAPPPPIRALCHALLLSSCKEVLLAFMVVMVVVVFVPSGLQTMALGCFVRTIISAVAASSRTTLLLIIITCEFKLARSKERVVGPNAGPLAVKLWDPSVCFQRSN